MGTAPKGKVAVQVYLTPPARKALKALAVSEEISASALIESWITAHSKQHKA